MYCRLLEEAVHEVKGEKTQEIVETTIDLNINAYIDSGYIKDEGQKIEIYKKIAGIKDKKDLYEVEEEIEDRFGDIPESLRNLLQTAYIKALASKINISSITQKNECINMAFSGNAVVKPEWILKLVEKFDKYITFNASKVPYIIVKTAGLRSTDIYKLLTDIVESMNDLQ
jgi:transcription-repair coupling factor (superfamily II helicase)